MSIFDRDNAARWAALWLAGFVWWLGTVSGLGDSATPPAVIKTFIQFYTLPPVAASNGIPVQIRGVIVCYDPGWNQLYIHDGSETAWFSPGLFQTNLQAGMSVEITGSTAYSHGSPTFTNLRLRDLGSGQIPNAMARRIPQLGADLGQWVEIVGRVRVAETSPGRLSLVIENQSETCLVYVLGTPATNDFTSLVGCGVRIRGINASKTAGGSLASAALFAPSLRDITVLETARNEPSEIPVTAIQALLEREFGLWTNDPIHIKGVIASYKPGEAVVVRDATGTIRARVIQTTEAPLDSPVDLWGYLTVSAGETFLRDAYFELQQPPPGGLPSSGAVDLTAPEPARPGEIKLFGDVSKMRPEEASRGAWVRLQGTVTYADTDWRICFIQGIDGALCSDLNQQNIKAGQWVEVTGQTRPGGFAPDLVNSRLRILGNTNLPAPVKTDLEDLANGNLDSHWVQLEGVVRSVTGQWGHGTLLLTTPKGRFKVIVPVSRSRALPADLLGALVSVQGACTSEMNGRGQLTGIILHAPDRDQITILEPVPADPFAVAGTAIRSVATFDAERLAGRRIKVAGTVTMVLPGQGFFIQDATDGLRVNTAQANALRPGDLVNVLGFPAIGDFSPNLEEASFQRTGNGPLPHPRPTTAEEILVHGAHDSTLVQIDAQLVQRVGRSAHPKLVMQSGPIVFSATVMAAADHNQIPDYEVGSLLRLVGVCAIQGGENHEAESFRLLVAQPRDVVLLQSPPWWTMRHTLILTVSLALGVILAWGWSSSLRRQVAAQTKVIHRNEEELIRVSRQAGMAEVATAVLHNVGNVLNSVNVSATLAADEVRGSKIADVSRTAQLMAEHAGDLGNFMTVDPRGRQLPGYLAELGKQLATERQAVLGELERLTGNIQHIKDIVTMQQRHAKSGGVREKVKVAELVEDALRMNAGDLERHGIQLVRDYKMHPSLEIVVEKHKVLQIFINLITNAKSACADSGRRDKRVAIQITNSENEIRVSVIDNGIGILGENLTRIFTRGFTTRSNGHGFGLHSAALAAQELGGKLQVRSDGHQRGAAFTLHLPWSPLNA